MIWGIIASVFYLLGIVSSVHAIMSTRTPQGAIAWSVSLITFPVLAVPLYWVFGRNKFAGVLELRQAHEEDVARTISRARSAMAANRAEAPPEGPTRRALEALSRMEFTDGNEVELLVDGKATFDSILAGIEAAKRYVLVQFYIVRDDGLGNRLAEAMRKKARDGVDTYFLYDEIGSWGLPRSYVQRLRESGVHAAAFNTTQGHRNRFQLNFRNHRKIVVVDGETAWIGGSNVGDEYLGLDPKIGPWRDTHVRMAGPAALQAQGVFLGDWFWARRELPDAPFESRRAPEGNTPVLVLPSSPAEELETASLVSVELLHAARERIWIATPYFVPDRAVMAALRVAALRGVDVRIILVEKADSLPVHLASFWYVDALENGGIRFYRYREGFMHQKVVVVDDAIGAVGTVNWDSRSFRLNFEVNVLVAEEQFAGELAMMLRADMERSRAVEPGELKSRSFFFRLAVQVARLLSPVL